MVKYKLPVADNLLKQRFEAAEPNKAWVSDITYIPTEEGRLYLAGHKDICTGEVVGYAMSDRITKNPVSRSLIRATAAKRPGNGLIRHSDRGNFYFGRIGHYHFGITAEKVRVVIISIR